MAPFSDLLSSPKSHLNPPTPELLTAGYVTDIRRLLLLTFLFAIRQEINIYGALLNYFVYVRLLSQVFGGGIGV